jgi:pullulanase
MRVDLFKRKQTHFVLWRVAFWGQDFPSLYIGRAGGIFQEFLLRQSPDFPELWDVAALECGLVEGQVYHYWFKVRSSSPYEDGQMVYCTDPVAYAVNRQVLSPGEGTGEPASVILYRGGLLVACDPQGQTVQGQTVDEGENRVEGEDRVRNNLSTSPLPPDNLPPNNLPPNNRLVIYELPVRWTKVGGEAIGVGTFRDVRSLLADSSAHLIRLGVNALELLPPADSDDKAAWGYGTANFFAADFDLGCSEQENSEQGCSEQGCLEQGCLEQEKTMAASTDLVDLIGICRQQGIRFFLDVVMAFARNNALRQINFADFFVQWKAWGMCDPEQGDRDGFGGDLFKFNDWVEGYHPITGKCDRFVPAREYLKLYLIHWMSYYGVNGLRLDSVNNIGNYDFVQEFKDLARQIWLEKGGEGDRFLVVGEDLSVPLALVHQNRLDGLWNEHFKQILRRVILGKLATDGESFEESVRQLIDCRLLGFKDGTQAVNYLTSHDVGGYGNERLYNYLTNNGIVNTEERIKLAFVCLMTAVGIPMILAGEEFGDQHDLSLNDSKQVDPVNYGRIDEGWRQRVFEYVARLTRFRTTSEALAVNDVVFIHVDFEAGKRVLVWRRGAGERIVVVVANFSDYGTPNVPGAEYVIPNFPDAPLTKRWKEITQDRLVAEDWVGREPIFPWEAKVYGLV